MGYRWRPHSECSERRIARCHQQYAAVTSDQCAAIGTACGEVSTHLPRNTLSLAVRLLGGVVDPCCLHARSDILGSRAGAQSRCLRPHTTPHHTHNSKQASDSNDNAHQFHPSFARLSAAPLTATNISISWSPGLAFVGSKRPTFRLAPAIRSPVSRVPWTVIAASPNKPLRSRSCDGRDSDNKPALLYPSASRGKCDRSVPAVTSFPVCESAVPGTPRADATLVGCVSREPSFSDLRCRQRYCSDN